ncbi:MAG TPA: hypothetical protein VM012_03440 [Flavitalea sp.]|nr:hypothetical protein [Flavitalea sp.]
MKNIYFATVLISLASLQLHCSKDVFKRYEKRILGTWRIVDINKVGIGGNSSYLPFRDGTITFNEDRSLVYRPLSGEIYDGHWDIDKDWEDENERRTLLITAVDFAGQHVLTEEYEQMNFRSTDHFVGRITNGFEAYVTHFRR